MMDIYKFIKEMSLEEKIGQLNLVSYNEKTIEKIKKGEVGAVLNVHGYEIIHELQEASLSSPHQIPLLIGDDVIHGYHTIFPVPIGEACSFNMNLIEETAYLSMKEAHNDGINWIYAPMLDLTNDPRWGRIMETSGEDPYLNSCIAKRRVSGIQREENRQITAACAKHYLGYGAVEAGLDYNTTEFSETRLRNFYLPAFVSAINQGVMSIMHAFTTYNDKPITMNEYILKDILRKECGFEGVLVTDWDCLNQLKKYQTVESDSDAAKIGLEVGIDIDMHSQLYINYLPRIIEDNPELSEVLDIAVLRILKIKEKMGLFNNPYNKKSPIITESLLREHSRKAGRESIILLKNEDNILPLNKDAKILVVGPFNEDKDIHLGAWSCQGKPWDVVSIKEGLLDQFPNCYFYNTPLDCSLIDWNDLKTIVKGYDVIITTLGEPRSYSGENNCRMTINFPFKQDLLIDFLAQENIPNIGVVLAGRPLSITNLKEKAKAILWCFHLGTEAGNSITDILIGKVSPSAKTVVTFPKDLGQVPIYYNRYHTGRDELIHYVDGDIEPLFPFGFGLSYANFEYHDLIVKNEKNKVLIDVQVTNTSDITAQEIVQVYILPKKATTLYPKQQLIDFTKIEIKERTVVSIHFEFEIKYQGEVEILVGKSSNEGIKKSIFI